MRGGGEGGYSLNGNNGNNSSQHHSLTEVNGGNPAEFGTSMNSHVNTNNIAMPIANEDNDPKLQVRGEICQICNRKFLYRDAMYELMGKLQLRDLNKK